MYQADAFKNWFLAEGRHKVSTYNTHNYYLKQLDKYFGGLDEKIKEAGIPGIFEQARSATDGPFEKFPSSARSILKRYIEFLVDQQTPVDETESVLDTQENADRVVFELEREMQAAVRKQLHLLEPGLKECDEGSEISVATGKIDILAEDKTGGLVVIELKAGPCPAGAVEQVLGYAEALSVERNRPVRAYLVAADFSDRLRAAAKRVRDLQLRTYEFSLKFHSPD